jgi:drug/metabolite transporter (DMT)-like permease
MVLSDQLLPNMEGTSVPAAPIASINGERPEEGRRWWILLAFCANSAANAFMFMDFTTVPTVTKQVIYPTVPFWIFPRHEENPEI